MRTLIPALVLVFWGLLPLSCKKKDKDPDPQPEPVKQGNVHFKIVTYDGQGRVRSDHSGITVSLAEDQKSAVTNAAGEASFSGLVYGYHTPVLTKAGYDGPLTTVYLDKQDFYATLPFPQHSPYKPENMNGKVFGSQAIFLSFNLSPGITPGDTVKVAIIGSPSSDMSFGKFSSVDVVKITQSTVTDYDLSSLPEFSKMVKSLDSAATFYASAVPVSYGLYNSNLQSTPLLLGHTLEYPGHVAYTKSWKN